MTNLDPTLLSSSDAMHPAGSELDPIKPDEAAVRDTYELRILFGPLSGVDILLPDTDVFFHVGDDVPPLVASDDEITPALAHAANVLYIPYPGEADHFRLHLSTATTRPSDDGEPRWVSHRVEFVGQHQVESEPLPHNCPVQHGPVAFAVKSVREQWSEEVTNFSAKRPFNPSESYDADATVQAPLEHRRPTWVLIALSVLAVVFLTALGYWQVNRYVASKHVASVASLLEHAPGHNTILAGRDGTVYVVNTTDDGADWDRQALLKAAPMERVTVTSIERERHRIEQALKARGMEFVTIRLNAPASPKVVILAGQDQPDQVSQLRQQLTTLLPYASKPEVLTVDGRDIVQSARALLDAINAHYRIDTRPHGVTFDLLGSPTDTQLAALQVGVLQFGQLWGTQYVNFDIAMRSNRLNGKSYWDGKDRYVLVHPDSWYFSQPFNGDNS
ncbi:PrgH/EprH family type III secretion apparatus protein [Burkholderia latens]|uniref:PrgH/EprH family type III secretion apparatus protein n=1 Tax=Burkholderia latens TaxID=488446 RepID=UPI00158F50A8|nr:PrgH/EprH family type III secretion apparatus protein [Burkholderia latens]